MLRSLGSFVLRRGRQIVRLLPCLLLSLNCFALDPHKTLSQYVQTTLTERNGLPQNSVYSMAQTRDGYIWFGTEEGIARFDGVRVTVLNTLQYKTLKDNYISILTAAQDGSLWIGTRSGVLRFKDGVFRTCLTPNSPITAIHEDRSGRIWVGSMNGLYSIAGDQVRLYKTPDGLPSVEIRNIAEGKDGTLWVGTAGGLASFSGNHFTSYASRDGLTDAPVSALSASRDGSLWIATAGGLSHWNGKMLQHWPASSFPAAERIASLIEDRDGTLWLAFTHQGIASFRDGKVIRYTTRQGLPSDDINSLFQDNNGHLWVGFIEGGAVELRDGLFSSFGVQEGLSSNMVWSVLQARDGSMWVGTDGKGLNHIGKDGSVRVYTTADGLADNTVYALCEAMDGSLWIGSDHGLVSRFKDGRFTRFSDPASKESRLPVILQDPGGDMWFGFHEENGLARFHDGRFQHYAVPGLLNTMTFAPDGSIWVGTDHAGVSRVKNGSVTTYTTAQGLLSNFAQAIYVDREGTVWAGTSPGGLNRIKNGHITTYSVEQGLFDLTVGAIIEDDSGNLWMTCNNGIFRVSKQELNDYADGRVSSIRSIVYGTTDGLRASECNFAAVPAVWKDREGSLWFATVGGVASIDPRRIREQRSELQLHIERVLFNQNAVPFEQGVTVGPGGGDLEIQFTAPDFTSPERIRFRYRLTHFDRDWVNINTRREAYYTKLPPGHYTFEVQAANGDSAWSASSAALELTLQPHFWQTAWFRTICVLGILALCAGLFRLRVRYLVTRNLELEERVNLRTRELQEAIKVAQSAQEALRELATRDGLTKLWNRRSIFELLTAEIDHGNREEFSVCVLMADLDHFKLVNDTYGHLAGDSVLQEVSNRIVELARPYDWVGRYGGEELMIVLHKCTLADGLKRAEELRHCIADRAIMVGGDAIRVTCSFGVAASKASTTAESLIAEADVMLYQAKRSGRNRVYAQMNQTPSTVS
jgi:diguanylate cyclase (GGDEF)-like protein